MKKKVTIGIISAVLLLAVGILLSVLLGGEKSYRNIQVQEALGTTTVVRKETDSLEAYKGMKLADGDDVEVMPESSLIMKLDEDKYVYAEADTKFQIKAAGSENSGKTVIVLEEGSVLVEIQEKLSEEEAFEVETINSTMAVRGTVFQVRSYKNEAGETVTAVAVFEGAVETTPLVGEAVSVEAGQMAQLTGTEIEVQEIDLEEVSDEILGWLLEMETAELAFEQEKLEQYLEAVEPTDAPTPVPTDEPTATNTPAPAATNTPVPTATNTPAPTATNTPAPTATNTPVPTATNTPAPTATNTPAPAATNTPAPTATNTPVPTKAPVATGNRLTGLDAFELTSRMVIGWNLGNALDSHGSYISSDAAPAKFVTSWGNEEPTKELFEAVKAAGFNTVRIPITWYQHIKYDKAKNQYTINEEWLAYVKKVVDYAYELDMFVIINAHHEDWVNVSQFTDATYDKAAKILTDLWSKVAETFADYDQHLIFEAMNEPRQTGLGSDVEWGGGDTKSWAYINKLNQVFVNAVRKQGSSANKERLLILPGYGASSNIATVKSIEVPENGGNIALSVHAYFPYFFAMDTGYYANHSFPGKSGYGENYEDSINTLFKELKSVSKAKNAPIIIGEFGASDFNNTDDRARWATHFLTKAKDAGITCIFWDNQATYNGTGEAYGLISRSTYTWFENSIPMVQAAMKVYGQKNDLPEYVEPVFDWSNIPVTSNWVQIYRSDSGLYIDTWGNLCLENWKPYINEKYDIVMVYQSNAEPYMVLQGGWHKVFSGSSTGNPYMIRFTFADVKKTMTSENVRLEDMYNYFASASSQPMTLYGVFAVPVK